MILTRQDGDARTTPEGETCKLVRKKKNKGTTQPSCEGVGLVTRVHTLFGGVHRLATALKEVEEVREEVQEIRDEWEGEEDEENGGLKVEETRSSCDDHEMTRTSET